ncbi:MAG: pyridoxamine 5'-phosphate oxidase family protein [Pseudomonadota bacterium]
MPAQNPVQQIRDDRVQARRLEDPNADVCFLALADTDGSASVRTLVLRNITENRFLLFMNQSSPKWKILNRGGNYELLLWYPSMQRQYRITGGIHNCDPDFVRQSWLRRPRGSKYLDILYEQTIDQSEPIASRETLVAEINRIKANFDLDTQVAPAKVAGIELVASRIEVLDLNREDRIYYRMSYTLEAGTWQPLTLVP